VFAACAAVCAAAASVVGWQTEASPSAAATSSDPLDGADLFLTKGCASCHTGPDSAPLMSGFPVLVSASDWAGERRPGLSAEEYLAESIRTPSVFISPQFTSSVGPADGMPPLGLSETEIDALVDYLLQG
jgi:mono/diheme cytochrome c family protein